jgi:hypothetical protein
MVNHEMESQLVAEATKRNAHQLLFSECMGSENLPYFRQAGREDKAVCEEVANKLTPKFVEDHEKMLADDAKISQPVAEKSAIERIKTEGVMPVLTDAYEAASKKVDSWVNQPEKIEFPDK